MRRLLIGTLGALCATLLVACGDATGPDGTDIPDGPLEIALVSGGGQEVQVTDTLPSDIVVQVTKGGESLPDQLVDWTVLHDNCGSPFVSTTRTDSSGVTGNRLVAGTRAYTSIQNRDVCQMEVRYALTVADTVQARVGTTVNYLVLPGEIDRLYTYSPESWLEHGDTINLRDRLRYGEDQYENRILRDSLLVRPDSGVGWRLRDSYSSSDASGPSGSGWTLVVDTAAFRTQGYIADTSAVDCDPNDDDPNPTDTLASYVANLDMQFGSSRWAFTGHHNIELIDTCDMRG